MSPIVDREIAAAVRDLAGLGRTPDRAAAEIVVARSVRSLSTVSRTEVTQAVLDDCVGLGPLAPIVADESVTDVLVNADGSVWVDAGQGLRPGAAALRADQVRPLAVRLAGLAGRRLDDSQPWVDGHLPDGIRLHAVLPPIAADGAHISLRVPARRGWTLPRLVAAGMCDDDVAGLVRDLVMARRTILVSGATGVGKTALLCALLAEIPEPERVVVVEDVREIHVDRAQVVALQGRTANVEGVGLVSMSQLIRQALRMRVDRLVVGEARGPEIIDLLTALNTGHAGLGTIHANSATDVLARCTALGGLAGVGPEVVVRQFAAAVDVVIHLARVAGQRRVAEIAVVDGATIVSGRSLRRGGEPCLGPGASRLEALRSRDVSS